MEGFRASDWFKDMGYLFDDVSFSTDDEFSNDEANDTDFCHSSEVEVWIEHLRKRTPLALPQVEQLCQKAREVLSQESNLVEVQSPVTVCGDIHGQFYDLVELFTIAGQTPDVNFVFLGDYVDRGRYSVVVISLLLALKIRYPNRLTLLRGNHEARQTTQVYGFYDECLTIYGSLRVWSSFMDCFDYLPISALIDDTFLCMHGGLSPSISSVDQIRALDRFQEVPHDGPICDLLWSDPDENPFFEGFGQSSRGAGCTWGSDVSTMFTFSNKLSKITRAHQVVNEGVDWCHEDKVVTVFSAPNYCYRTGNLAGYLFIEQDKIETFTFEAAPRAKVDCSKNPFSPSIRTYFA